MCNHICSSEERQGQHAEEQTAPVYQKPQTSFFLQSSDIQGGLESMPESNSGLLS